MCTRRKQHELAENYAYPGIAATQEEAHSATGTGTLPFQLTGKVNDTCVREYIFCKTDHPLWQIHIEGTSMLKGLCILGQDMLKAL